jgi:hypothetical protein
MAIRKHKGIYQTGRKSQRRTRKQTGGDDPLFVREGEISKHQRKREDGEENEARDNERGREGEDNEAREKREMDEQLQELENLMNGGKTRKTKKTKKTKKVRKHKGIHQIGGNKGRLQKGYKYSGKRLKNGMPEILKVK